jgi:concentrative nucleoside transporter, CNT family
MPRSPAHADSVTTGGWAAIRANVRGFSLGWGYCGAGGPLGVAITWAGRARTGIPWRVVGAGILDRSPLLIKSPPVAAAFLLLNDGVGALQKATDAGTAFVFGYRAGPW